MGTNDESVWLFKINPKVLEVLNQLLRTMEQLSMTPLKEEQIQVPDRMPGALLTVDEATKRLAVIKYTLRGWVSRRRIPHVKIGRRTLFNPADLDNLIKA
jgi:excisionase family DNA binding protein